ncbi:MAG TPA: GAF and ANTAR domain-containing protein [Mycobacteriales bacterium]|nr:GAF and ANTAR domain-containing protein [Mycobacteriales bacterium]
MAFTDETLRELTALTGVVLAQQDLASVQQEITRIAVRALPGAEGATITTMVDGRPAASAASDDWARQLDEMQYVEHEGPCLDAMRTGNTHRVRDLDDEQRWPFYRVRARQAGARSIVSFPLASEGRLVGALNVYSRSPDAFSSEDVSIGDIIAAHTGLATQVATAYFGHRDLADQLRTAMLSRAVIEQAKGIVMAGRGIDADDAFDLLRTTSQHRNTKLRDVAQQVVDALSARALD